MHFEYNERTKYTLERIRAFMGEHIYPNEETYFRQLEALGTNRWQVLPLVEELKAKARKAGLWNLFLPDSERGGGFTNLEYAPMCEEMGRVLFASEVFNCSAPDTGNMEVLERYGSEEQKKRWLGPLLAGETRSAFAMTEPDVASSDATNIRTEIRREGDEYVINGRKWWTSGIADTRCKLIIVMGRTNPDAPVYMQQSQILVDRDTPGVTVERNLPVFGYDDAPHGHGEVTFENVRVPASNIVLGEGRGFEIAQGRLGPGRIHHCMRTIGVAERSLEMMCERLLEREAFGKPIGQFQAIQHYLADMATEIELSRLITYKAAWLQANNPTDPSVGVIASMAKMYTSEAAFRCTDKAMRILAGYGFTMEYHIQRYYRDIRQLVFAPITNEMSKCYIGQVMLGQKKCY